MSYYDENLIVVMVIREDGSYYFKRVPKNQNKLINQSRIRSKPNMALARAVFEGK